MKAQKNHLSRRSVIKNSAVGILGLALPNFIHPNNGYSESGILFDNSREPHPSFPYIDPEVVSEVVGKSHFDLERVKELVDKRPELARASWEWRFGDWESAIGAASHVGRRDIALYLLEKGARPSIFTFAMLGASETVKSIIEFFPGIQKTMGPHGISLLSHAYAGERMKDKMNGTETYNLKKTIDYLESLGNADGKKYMAMSPEENEKYLGDYKYGDGPKEGFSIQLNMRKIISLGGIGEFGGGLYKIGENRFIYNGVPSVEITFDLQGNRVRSLTIHDPELTLTAKKVTT